MHLILIQNPKTQSIIDTGQGGNIEITQAIASAACAGMPDKWLHAIRYLILRDERSGEAVRNYLLEEAHRLKFREKWKKVDDLFIKKMVDLAIIDHLGLMKFRDEEHKASILGISRRTWFRKWKSRYSNVAVYLYTWEECGKSYIRSRI